MNGKDHAIIGKAAGTVMALARADQNDTFWDLVLRAVGGYVGGNVGQVLPDFLEPAIHSFHRDVAHSIAFGVGVVELTRRLIEAWEMYCRTQAAAARERRNVEDATDGDRFGSFAEETFWKMAIGFAPGVAAGYVSHLAADATTPRGIPMLTRGF